MSGFNLKTFDKLLSKTNIDADYTLTWLLNKKTNYKDSIAGAWCRVASLYGSNDKEAINHLNTIYTRFSWYEIMVSYFEGYIDSEDKNSFTMNWRRYNICPENTEIIFNSIKREVISNTEKITQSFHSLNEYLIKNEIVCTPNPSTIRYKGIIAYCALHKNNLNYANFYRNDCLHRNGKSMCSNLLIIRSAFWRTVAGQNILSSTSISNRVRYKQ